MQKKMQALDWKLKQAKSRWKMESELNVIVSEQQYIGWALTKVGQADYKKELRRDFVFVEQNVSVIGWLRTQAKL